MNEKIKLLTDLQVFDLQIHEYQKQLDACPVEIERKKQEIQVYLQRFNDQKQNLTNLQLKKKEKELECAAFDEKVKKNEKELNSVKSNDMYKALLSEIENSKKQKDQIEDEILNIMLETDQISAGIKTVEADVKKDQQRIEGEIRQMENEAQKIQALRDAEAAKRSEFAKKIPEDLLSRYHFIQDKMKTNVLSAIKDDMCSGCHTGITQLAMNEVRKNKDLIICESCSRILYFPETEPAENPPVQA